MCIAAPWSFSAVLVQCIVRIYCCSLEESMYGQLLSSTASVLDDQSSSNCSAREGPKFANFTYILYRQMYVHVATGVLAACQMPWLGSGLTCLSLRMTAVKALSVFCC